VLTESVKTPVVQETLALFALLTLVNPIDFHKAKDESVSLPRLTLNWH
jgi:hypothetical protein